MGAAFVMLMISISPTGKIEPTFLGQYPTMQQCNTTRNNLLNMNGLKDTSDVICVRNPLSKDKR